jgi:predicted flap endonuclease-1-like 5' DNA nuclease
VPSTFWFLLEFTVLLALAAGVFAWLGWMWRGSERGDRLKKLQNELEEQRRMARAAMDERDAVRAEASNTGGSVHVSDAAPLIQANEALENENIRLREERKNLESRLASLQADNAQLFSQSSTNLAEALKKQHQLEADLAVAQAFAAEVSTLRQQLADAKVAHQSEVSTIQQKLNAATSADEELSALTAEVQNAREAAKNAQTSLKASRAEIAALQQKLAESTTTAEKALEGSRAEISALEQKLAQSSAELQKVQNDLQASRAEAAALLQKLAEAPPAAPAPVVQPVVEAPAPAPAPKVEKAAPKPRATKKKAASSTAHNAQEKLSHIETALAPQLSVLAALTQERDDWQRRVTMLESRTPPDLAGLGLARRSLASSAERLAEAQAAVESLQNQQRALHKTLQQTTELASVPDDDLTKIKGIKGVLSDQLHALGIRTWKQIADWNDDDLRAFSELLAFKNRATRDHWQEQARLLAQP